MAAARYIGGALVSDVISGAASTATTCSTGILYHDTHENIPVASFTYPSSEAPVWLLAVHEPVCAYWNCELQKPMSTIVTLPFRFFCHEVIFLVGMHQVFL
jgi:hypothetical protein